VLAHEDAGRGVPLLDDLGVDRAVVVGLSMGGLVAMELALRHSERLLGTVFAATTAAPVTPEEAARRRAVADDLERNGMLAHAFGMAGKLFGPSARRDPDLVESVFGMMVHTSPEGAAAALRGRAERPATRSCFAISACRASWSAASRTIGLRSRL
jgi:3-oxoadipate enol-lactonase